MQPILLDVQETQFAPAERYDHERCLAQYHAIIQEPMIRAVFDAMPDPLIVLNDCRQVVFANRTLLNFLHQDELSILGQRPGELMGCGHASDSAGGCGTSSFCSQCGAVQAILSAFRGKSDQQECRITRDDDGSALDFRISTTPMSFGEEPMSLCVLTDISDQKRRVALERMFFHDILNTAGGLRGYANILSKASMEQQSAFAEAIQRLAGNLVETIQCQQQLSAAEVGELRTNPTRWSVKELLHELAESYRKHEVAVGRCISIEESNEDVLVHSDRVLSYRVVGNMLKNALEASDHGQTITLSIKPLGKQVQVMVHNEKIIPRQIQLQIFHRSFSTKGKGRGLGTYSMKLIAERYLNGGVHFTSVPDAGTTFYMTIPVNIDAPVLMRDATGDSAHPSSDAAAGCESDHACYGECQSPANCTTAEADQSADATSANSVDAAVASGI